MQEAEVRRGGGVFGAETHADELNFGDDEAVAGVVFAHHALKVRQLGEEANVGLALFVPHACVPHFVGFDETDDAATTVAADGVGDVVGIGGEEEGSVFG